MKTASSEIRPKIANTASIYPTGKFRPLDEYTPILISEILSVDLNLILNCSNNKEKKQDIFDRKDWRAECLEQIIKKFEEDREGFD